MKRRDLLKYMSLSSMASTSPLYFFLNSFLNNVYAQTTGKEFDGFYFPVHLGGGPVRWLYDAPMALDEKDLSVFEDVNKNNKMVSNTFMVNEKGQLVPAYKMFQYNSEYLMPLIWNRRIATVDGMGKFSDILDNCLMVRGISMPNPAHTSCKNALFQPSSSEETISGIIAKHSKKPIPASRFGDLTVPHYSKLGLPTQDVNNSKNPIQDLLGTFIGLPGIAFKSDVEEIIDQALLSLDKRVDKENITRRGILSNRKKAKQAFLKSWGVFIEEYPAILTKYKKLMQDSFKISLDYDQKGQVDIQPWELLEGDAYKIGAISDPDGVVKTSELYRMQGVKTDSLVEGKHFSESFTKNTAIGLLPQTFAIGEFLFKYNIASSFSGRINNMIKLNLGKGAFNFAIDSHDTGVVPTNYFYHKYFQAITSCLNEFRLSAINEGRWDKTLISLQSEFARLPRCSGEKNGTGSDHGWTGSNLTYISGKFNKLQVTGHLGDDTVSGRRGIWGRACTEKHLEEGVSGGAIGVGNINATTADILGIENPISNGSSILKRTNGNIEISFKGKTFKGIR